MMSNYQRTMELTGYATNSAGASQKQFEKTMESLESKLNRLHNAWENFTTGIAKASTIKGAVDLLTTLLTAINKITEATDPAHTGITKILAAILGFKAAKGIVNGVLRNIGTQIAAGMGKEGEKAAGTFLDRFTNKLDKTKSKFKIQEVVDVKGKKDFAAAQATKAAVAQEEYNQALIRQKAATEAQAASEARLNGLKEREAALTAQLTTAQSAEIQSELTQNEIENTQAALKANKEAQLIAEAELEAANATATSAAATATELQAKAEEENVAATTAAVAAKEAENANENLNLITKVKLYAALLFGNKVKREEVRQTLASAGAKWAEAGATGTATGAQWALNAAIYACPLGWILVGLAALAAVFVVLSNAIETDNERLKKWTEVTEELNTQLSDVNTRINDLQDGWSTLLDTKKELDGLTQGTLEWKQKLLEVNQQVIDLINKMPELAQFVTTTSSGELEISQNGYDYVLQKQIEASARLQNAVLLAQAEQAESQASIDRQTYRNNIASYSEKQNAKISYQSSQIQYEKIASISFDRMLDNYEETNNKLSDNNKILAKEVLANKKNLKAINDKQRSAKVDKALYGQLVGLTEAQVQEQLDNKDLSEDTIKATIAINEYQNEYANQVKKLVAVARSLNVKQFHALSGASALTETEIRKINTAQFKQFRNELGEIDLSNNNSYEKAKQLLGQELGFTNEELSKLESSGADFEKIISGLMDGQQQLSDYWNKMNALTTDSRKVVGNYIDNLQKQISSELSIEQLDTIGTFIEKIASNGGDIQKSIGYIETLFKDIKTPEDLTQALSDLNNISLDDENFVELLTNKLSELGIEVDKNVVTQLNEATKAANKFSLSNITGQLTARNVAYADALKRKKDNDINFTDKEYEEYTKAFADSGYDIANYFLQNDDGTYTLIKSWDDLIKVLYSTTGRVKEITQATEDYNSAIDKTNKVQAAASIFDTSYKNWQGGAPNSADILYGILTNENTTFADYLVDDFKELFQDLPTAKSTEALEKKLLENNNGELDYEKIAVLMKAMEINKDNKSFWEALPKSVLERIKDLNDNQLKAIFSWSGEDVFSTYNLVVEKLNSNLKYVQDVDISEDIDKTVEAVKKIPGISKDLISGLESLKGNPEKFKEKLDEILTLYADLVKNTSLSSLQKEQEKSLITGAKSARDLVDLRQNKEFDSNSAQNIILYEQKLTSIVAEHKNWEQQLQTIQEKYGYTKQAALEVLAVQYEQEEAVDNIISTLGDYEGVFTETAGKGTTEYIEGIYSLVEEFQKIFGEDIDFAWVEENLEDIKKLKEGGEDAEAAMKRLGETSKAQKYEIKIETEIDIKDLEKEEGILDNFKTALDDVAEYANKDSEIAQTKIGEVKSALDALDNSEASIEVKANTKAAFADLIRTGIARAAADGNVDLLNYLVDLAYSGGFKVSGMGKIIRAKVENGKVSYEFSENARDYTDYLQINPWMEDENGNLVYDDKGNPTIYKPTETTTHEIDTPAQGTGKNISTDKSTSKDKSSDDEDDWTNDWNRQYALLKKIENLERERNKLDKEHNRWVKSYALMEDNIVESKEKQRKNLMKQIELNEQLAQNTRNELESLNQNSAFGGSIWFDQENSMIRTNDEHIYSMDKETKEAFDDVKSQYESLASQLESAQDNIDSAVDAIEELTAGITEIDYQTQLDNFIKIIDHTLSLYDKAIARLDRPGQNPSRKDILDLFNAASKERVEKNRVLTEQYIRAGAQLDALTGLRDYKKYFSFDWDTGKLTRNSAYYSLGDSDLKDKIDAHLTKIEDLAEIRRTAEEERESLADEQYEAEQAIAEKANEWQKNIYDAVISEREEQISKLETINTSIQDASSKLIDSMQKSIQKIRQDRKNEKTEEELSDMQSKLAYLQADTSGANEVEIRKLQKQLTEKQESYTDTLIDQKITELQDQNKEAAEQRKQQIEIAKAQLQFDKQTGAIWGEVRGLISAGLMANGRINGRSELGKLINKWGSYNSLSAYDKQEFTTSQSYGAASYSANQSISRSGGYQDQLGYQVTNSQYNALRNSTIQDAKNALADYINNTTPYKNYMRYDSSKNTLIQTELFPYPEGDEKALHDTLEAAWQSTWERINYINGLIGYFDVNNFKTSFTHTPGIARHAEGGLVDYTGLHWLDGTPSDPELVLNAKDTKNFIALKDILSGVMKNSSSIPQKNGDINCEVNINVDSISSDYDVDQIAARVQYNILQSANWRNVNNLSMMR